MPALGVSAKRKLSARHRGGSGKFEKDLSKLRRFYAGIVRRHRAIGRFLQELEAFAVAGGAELDDVDIWHEFQRSEHHFRREPVWLSLPQRRRRRVVDEIAAGAERDRGGVLVGGRILSGFEFRVNTPIPAFPRRGGRSNTRKKRRATTTHFDLTMFPFER